MNDKKNWSAMSIVCVVQTIVCGAVLVGILLFKLIGGPSYEQAADWYRDNISDTIMVYPETAGSSEIAQSAVESDG